MNEPPVDGLGRRVMRPAIIASPAAVLACDIAGGAALPGMPGGPVGSLTVGRVRITLARYGAYRLELTRQATAADRAALARLDGRFRAFLACLTPEV